MGTGAKRNKRSATASPNVSAQLSQMQKSIDAQQQQIQQLMQQLQSRDQSSTAATTNEPGARHGKPSATKGGHRSVAEYRNKQDVGAVRSDVLTSRIQ